MKKCRICEAEIHPQRLEASPRTVTCSPKCAAANRNKNIAKAVRRWRRKKAK